MRNIQARNIAFKTYWQVVQAGGNGTQARNAAAHAARAYRNSYYAAAPINR